MITAIIRGLPKPKYLLNSPRKVELGGGAGAGKEEKRNRKPTQRGNAHETQRCDPALLPAAVARELGRRAGEAEQGEILVLFSGIIWIWF